VFYPEYNAQLSLTIPNPQSPGTISENVTALLTARQDETRLWQCE